MRLLSHGEKPRSQGHLRNPSRLTTFCLLALISCSHLLVSNVVVHIKACESQPHEQQISSRRSFARAVALPLATSASFHSNFWRCVLVGLLLCCHTSEVQVIAHNGISVAWDTDLKLSELTLSAGPDQRCRKAPLSLARRRSRCLKIAPGEAQPERGNQIQLIIQTAVGQSVIVGSSELGPYNSYISQFSYSTSVPGPYAIEIEYEWAIIFLKRPYY